MKNLNYHPKEDFEFFIQKLKDRSQREWTWLVIAFRKRLMPVLMARAKSVGSGSYQTQKEFAEEVFEECLLKFYELFENGTFNRYEDLEATIVTISGYKLKEGHAKFKRNQRLYFMNAEALANVREKYLQSTKEDEQIKIEQVKTIKAQIKTLPSEESDLILRYFNGEELQDIAEDLSISPAACRKRKQRILEKLRTFVFDNIHLLLLILLS